MRWRDGSLIPRACCAFTAICGTADEAMKKALRLSSEGFHSSVAKPEILVGGTGIEPVTPAV
jgi:hypothetical protein